jgi:hypothetical protein
LAFVARRLNGPPALTVTAAWPAASVLTGASAPLTVAPSAGDAVPLASYSTTLTVNAAPGVTVRGVLSSIGRTGGFVHRKSGAGPVMQRSTKNRTSSPCCSSLVVPQTPSPAERWLIHSEKYSGAGNACVSPLIVWTL